MGLYIQSDKNKVVRHFVSGSLEKIKLDINNMINRRNVVDEI